ncbi:MAG: PIN domain-containing protein [Candidatus Micrarchaeota archaeon]
MSQRPVILDTNFLLIPFQFKIDIFRELDYLIEISHNYVISSRTITELETLGKRIGKDGMAARLALKLVVANSKKITIVENNDYVDDWIVEYAKTFNAIVCTNDSKLRKRLREARIKAITMKSKSKLGYV